MRTETDLLIVGGGINGAGIARDAAGRGLRVVLCEAGDLGGATSSASSKLVHGGLRYLEQLEFRLVAEALAEREVLLRAAPHLVRPMRFVMPHAPGMRPAWIIRAGLFLYDRLAQRQVLQKSGTFDLARSGARNGVKGDLRRAYGYSDCWVDDARLVIANVRAAADAGATILPRTACESAARVGARWRARLRNSGGAFEVEARALVNATGVSVAEFLSAAIQKAAVPRVKRVQGSHIVVPRIYEADHAYILQNDDRRVVFVYPYEERYTLIGTTDVELPPGSRTCRVTSDEIAYLCRAANRYLTRQIAPADVRWSFCGIRALADDGASNPSRVTRDYQLHVDAPQEAAPIVSVYGGKITTYRRLAERVLDRLGERLGEIGPAWTATARLPGGDMPGGDPARLLDVLAATRPGLPRALLRSLAARHGSRAADVLGNAAAIEDLGHHFGADLYAKEVDHFLAHEWAVDADDIVWRRTKAGLHLAAEERAALVHYVAAHAGERVR